MTTHECWLCGLVGIRELEITRIRDLVVFHHPVPFNNGHLVITPLTHVDLHSVDNSLLTRMLRITSKLMVIIEGLYSPHGFNVGIVPMPHLNIQVIPRWGGDVNFMPLFFNTKVVPESILTSVRKVRDRVMEHGLGDN